MKPKILSANTDGMDDSEVISLVAQVEEFQLSANEFETIRKCLGGVDHINPNLFFPSLKHLNAIIRSQKPSDELSRIVGMFAVEMWHANWRKLCPEHLKSDLQNDLKETSSIFHEHSWDSIDLKQKRFMLLGMAACSGDMDGSLILNDLACGNTGENSSIKIE